jgi:hypothetical protein
MDFDSTMIVLSLIGLGMAPFWVKWWGATLPRRGLVWALSIATTVVACVGPWMVMGGDWSAFANPRIWPSLAIVLAIIVAMPVVFLWGDRRSNAG